MDCHFIIKNWKYGNLLILNNLRYLHGRGEIKGKRWLQRCYGSSIIPSLTRLNLDRFIE